MSYLLVKAEESFFEAPFFFLNPGVQPKPAIVGVTLKNSLKRYKAEYQKVEEHLPYSVYFQRDMKILDRDTSRITLQTFFAQFLPSNLDQRRFNAYCAIVDSCTPIMLKQMLREVSLNIARNVYYEDALFSFYPQEESKAQLTKILHVFQHRALTSNASNQFLVDLFLAYQIPQPVIDFEVAVIRAFMNDLFCDLQKRTLILTSIREWQAYSIQEKISFLQAFVEWHSAAFSIMVPKVFVMDNDALSFGYLKECHQICIKFADMKDRHVVDLMLFCLHENIHNYQIHLYHDFDMDSKQNPQRTTDFYKELSGIKEARQYVKTLYLSALSYQVPEQESDFYYLQPLKFHAFTHEFLFATLFLEEFSKVDSSQTLFLFQKIASLCFRQEEGYLEIVENLLATYQQGSRYARRPLDEIIERVMPRYLTFLEVYHVGVEGFPSLMKAFKELERYGTAFQKLLPKEEVIEKILLTESYEERVEQNINALLDDDAL